MKNIQKIEKEVEKLPPEDLAEFRAWFEKYDSEVWDRQFETDVNKGKLDRLAEQAVNDYNSGSFKKV